MVTVPTETFVFRRLGLQRLVFFFFFFSRGASAFFIDRLKPRCIHKTCHQHTIPPPPIIFVEDAPFAPDQVTKAAAVFSLS